jgi:hypothetical protein
MRRIFGFLMIHCFVIGVFLGEQFYYIITKETDDISCCEVAERLGATANKMRRTDMNSRTSKIVSLLSDSEDYYRSEQFAELANSFF